MKFTGIIKKIDELGRLILPREIRKSLLIKERDAVEIFVKGDTIYVKPFNDGDNKLTAGIIRNVDEMGRIVLPKEIRESFGAPVGSKFEISVSEGYVLLRKYEDVCIFCASTEDLKTYEGKYVCAKCIQNLSTM